MDFGVAMRPEWLLEDGFAYLNHGSFGAAPRRVLEAQAAWRERLERQPVRFMEEELRPELRAAADGLADFLGARGRDLVFVDNATSGVNAVVRSLRFGPGDEILTTTHAYGAVRKALRFACDRSGATLVEAALPFPLSSPAEVLAAVEPALGPRTRLAVVDHVTSPTGVILPVERLVALCRGRGVPVLVDGAHAPGMLEVAIETVGADFYTGNAHKWLCAPKGCAFLWARPERQADLHPTVISHGYGRGFLEEFDWTGTRDPSAYLSITAALDFHRALGPERVRAHNHALADRAADLLAAALGLDRPAPPAMIGSMATLPAPGRAPATEEAARDLNRRLRHEHRIEVPVLVFGERLWLRVSAQVYNHLAEYERLARALGAAS